MRPYLWLLLLIMAGCQQPDAVNKTTADPVEDPHSFARPARAVATHLDLDLAVDFNRRQLKGKATWTIRNISGGNELIFDNQALAIEKVTVGAGAQPVSFRLSQADSILGQPLRIPIEADTRQVTIYYHTTDSATALQWLAPAQTAGKKMPFLFSQSESILARTWVPCQDGPGIRITYNATIRVPHTMMALMSAGDNPQQKNDSGIYRFRQTHPVPSYLLALAVGDLAFKAVDSRTGIYAEPPVLNRAAWEFADMGKMVGVAEQLYGPYRWGRYDLLVLPPSFPFGGMENPNLTFATPTVIAGDRSLVSLVAHELAHSWSGNLVTNATWNDMWLNEGFTTYFEKRIVEALYGKEEAGMQEVLSRQDLEEAIQEAGPTNRDTRLKGDYAGRNPDDAISAIPYEKGYAFLRMLEAQVGRPALDSFLKSWFDGHAFQSQTTEQFETYLKARLLKGNPELYAQLKIQEWIYEPGIPSNIPVAASPVFAGLDSLIRSFEKTHSTVGFEKRVNTTNKRLYFLRHLPDTLAAGYMAQLDKTFGFTQSNNAEVQCVWYSLAVKHRYQPAYARTEAFLLQVGRRKLLVPVYGQLVKTAEGKAWAQQIFQKAKEGYHPLAVQTIGTMVK